MRDEESFLDEGQNKFRKVRLLRMSQAKDLRRGFGSTYASTSRAFMNTATLRTVLSRSMGLQLEHFALFEKSLQLETQSLIQVSWTFIRLRFQMLKITKGKIYQSISSSNSV